MIPRKRIEAPRFVVTYLPGQFVMLDEYNLRQLMLEVAQGLHMHLSFSVTDEEGSEANILDDGTLTTDLYGLSIINDIKFEYLKVKRS